MKPEKLPEEIKNWRKQNMAKAREALAIKQREKKLALIKTEVDALAETVDDKVEEAVEKGVKKILDTVDLKKIKNDFCKVFYKTGGVKGMLDWIKRHPNNKLEYYKLLISLLKSEGVRAGQQQGQKQAVVVNIITPDMKKETIINTENEQTEEDGNKL